MAIVAYLIPLVIYPQRGSIMPEHNSASIKARKYLFYSKGTKVRKMRNWVRCKIIEVLNGSVFSARAFFVTNTQNLFSKTIGYAFVNHLPLK